MSTLTYRPPVTTPGGYTDLESGHTLTAEQDFDSESPLHWLDSDETFWPFRGSFNSIYPLPAETIPAQQFERLIDVFDLDLALRILNRWSSAYGTGEQFRVTTLPGYSQGDWVDVLEPVDGSPITGSFEQWRMGGVYGVSCLDCDSINLGGIYADTEESAITHYLEEGFHND